jgi:hypothetical protein
MDDEKKRIRRLNGSYLPTPYQGPDEEWQDYDLADTPIVGREPMIWWKEKGKVTRLSTVQEVMGVA